MFDDLIGRERGIRAPDTLANTSDFKSSLFFGRFSLSDRVVAELGRLMRRYVINPDKGGRVIDGLIV